MSAVPRPSYWEKQTTHGAYDVIVVGGGIVGLNAAITCLERRPGLNVLVVDRGVFPIGASTRNAGFACFGSISEVLSDIKEMGYEAALALFVKRKQGLERLIALVSDKEIDLEWYGGFEVFTQAQHDVYEECNSSMGRLNADLRDCFGGNVFEQADDQMGSHGLRGFEHMISHPYEGQLHPGKLVRALQRKARDLGATVVGGVAVESIEEDGSGTVTVHGGHVFKGRITVVCTNGFARRLLPGLDIRPARNQVVVTSRIENLQLKGTFHHDAGYVYFRNIDGRILIGGARNLVVEREATETFGLTDDITEWLREFVEAHITPSPPVVEYAWSGIMGLGPDKHPIVAMASERIAVAVRLGGMGVAIGSLVGKEVAEMAIERL